MKKPFDGFDFSDFWNDIDYSLREYVDIPPTDAMIATVEERLKYKLPESYIALGRLHNGGWPHKNCHRTAERTSWARDHIAISGIYAIGSVKPRSLLGARGSAFWPEEWGYPDIGIYFADCPSAGHDMLCLDYSECGPAAEPRVVHIAQEFDYKITHVARDFESFIRGLETGEPFGDDSDL